MFPTPPDRPPSPNTNRYVVYTRCVTWSIDQIVQRRHGSLGALYLFIRDPGICFVCFFVVFDSRYQYDFLRSMQPMQPMQCILSRSILTNTTHTINATNTCNQHNPSAPTGRLGTYFFTVQSVVEFTPRRQTRGVRYFGQNGAFRGRGHQPWRLVSGGIKHVYFIPSINNFVVLVLNRGLITFSGHSFKNIF